MNKKKEYDSVQKMITSLLEGENNLIANLANTPAVIFERFELLWVGFYFVSEAENQLVLGPFQGPLACTRINYGKGVCGTAWKDGEGIIVPDVDSFPGHIACSALSKSEIVIPIKKDGKVVAILDIDSEKNDEFNQDDLVELTKICKKLSFLF
jgi:L-methionine (R)-S-oxide reductase